MNGEPNLRARARLIVRAQRLGYDLSREADLHMLADQHPIEPSWHSPKCVSVTLPASFEHIELRCRSYVPAHVHAASEDSRALGLGVGGLDLDGRVVALGEAAKVTQGWQPWESNAGGDQWRWTQLVLRLPAGVRLVVIDLVGRCFYWSAAALGFAATA
jgi:hypothetical protein